MRSPSTRRLVLGCGVEPFHSDGTVSLYDLIFPLFLFCIGVAVPISVERRLWPGVSKGRVLQHAFVRLACMVFFGWWVNGNLLSWDPSKFSLSYSVLMMLGFGYLIAVCLVLFTRVRTQIWVTVGILWGTGRSRWASPYRATCPGNSWQAVSSAIGYTITRLANSARRGKAGMAAAGR